MKCPRISVVMGVRNEAASVCDSLAGVLGQECVDLEVIVVDDGSTDGTCQILEAVAAADARVRVMRSEGGLTRALIAGCREVRGEFIARQDAGDWSLPGRLCEEAALFDANPGVGLVCCDTEFVGPDGDFLYVSTGHCEEVRPTEISPIDSMGTAFAGPSHHGAVMFRRVAFEQAGGYREEFARGQDWDLWYRMGERWKFQRLPAVKYRATIRPSGVSLARRREQQAFAALSLEARNARLSGRSDAEVVKRASRLAAARAKAVPTRADESRSWYFLGECLRRNGNPRAVDYLRRSVGLDPRNVKAWVRWAQAAVAKWART